MRWDRTKGRPEPVAALDRIPTFENGDPLVPLSEVAPAIRLIRPTTIPYCRKAVAEMVQRAAETLPDGVYLAVTDAYRPLLRQIKIYEFMTRCAREAFPDREGASLKRTVNRWVAPPDRKAPPGHCTGAALDVILVDANNEPIDVTSPFSRFQGGPTYVFGLTEEAQRNRNLLVDVMLSVGFSNCRDEWWHYSYGDAGWAVRMDQPTCFYGLAELEPELYTEQQQLWEDALRERPNPFLES